MNSPQHESRSLPPTSDLLRRCHEWWRGWKSNGVTTSIEDAFIAGYKEAALSAQSERMKKAFLSGVLAALDHLIGITHDEPVIAAEIVRAVGARDLMLLAKEQDYPFLKQLRDLYRKENIEW